MNSLTLGLLCLAGTQLMAQTANVQVIHNSPDPLAATVDIYLNGGATPAIDNLDFREATAFIQLPINAVVGVAPGNSTGPSSILASFPLNLTANENYVVMATGVLTPALFDQSANGTNINFDLKILSAAQTTAPFGSVNLVAYHGATDAPTVDVLANGGILINDLAFKSFAGYLAVPAAGYVLDVTPGNDNNTIVASYYADLSGLGGGAAVVFASGFLTPANDQNGPAFGLYAALPDGTVIALPTVGTARAQVIHNAADPAAATVDVYVNTRKDTIKIDNFAFRSATPFLTLPAGYPIGIVIASPTSTAINDQVITTIPATLAIGETYALVANGVLNPAAFAPNPNAVSTDFSLLVAPGVREAAATGGNVDIKVLHGATDAPAVGVNANGNVAVPTASYKDFTGYLSVPAAEYRVDVTGANAPGTLIAPFYVDASTLGGGATLIFASGFLTPSANQNGPAFGLYAAFANGTVAPLTPVGNARAQVIHNAADPGAASVDIYVNTLAAVVKLDNVAFRTATGFLDLPTGYPVDIVIAGPTSTSITDQVVATIPASLMNGEKYHIVANGVLNPANFAANPTGTSTAFNLFVNPGAREAAVVTSNVELTVFHGATDAPRVDVLANGGTPPVVSNLEYTEFNGSYLSLPPATYTLGINLAGTSTRVATYAADASGLGGGAGIVLASGFLTPATNQNGEAFGLLLVLADGTAILLPISTGIDELPLRNELLEVYPNPAAGIATLNYEVEKAGDVTISVLDIAGREVSRQVMANQPAGSLGTTLDVSTLTNGYYTVMVTTRTSRALLKLVVAQ
ncbi:MAG: DUF4397 domain-containing protein [Bacteroidia bacterium]|nr:DUF4397 domain-containing protein [Bacteroidia bacterium]